MNGMRIVLLHQAAVVSALSGLRELATVTIHVLLQCSVIETVRCKAIISGWRKARFPPTF